MADLNKIIEDLSSLTVVEAAELSKQLEEKWGVTAAAAVTPHFSSSCFDSSAASTTVKLDKSSIILFRSAIIL
jgi:ribosomal protein L7/L12